MSNVLIFFVTEQQFWFITFLTHIFAGYDINQKNLLQGQCNMYINLYQFIVLILIIHVLRYDYDTQQENYYLIRI